MRRARGRVAAAGSRHISLSATDAEWGVVRRNADRRGLSIARYLVGLVERDGSEGRVDLALARGEQRELLEAVHEIRALLLGHEVPSGPGPAEPDPEVPGHDADGARLRREIRDWPARAAPLLANRLRPEAPLSTLADRRRRIESLLAEAAAMQAGEGPHAPHLEAMPEESAALAEMAGRLSHERYRAVQVEVIHIRRKTREFARDTGGIPFDAEDYGALMDRVRWIDAQPDLPERIREVNWQMFAWDARWRRERDRVAGFLERAGGFLRARKNLEEEIRVMYEPPGLTAAAGNWRVEARDLLDEAKALGHGIPRQDLDAHLNAAGSEPDAIAELAARIRAMLIRDEEARAAMPGSYPAGDPE